MMGSEIYNIAMDKNDIVVRLNGDLFDREELTKLLDYLELESLRKRSQLTEAQAAELAAEIKQRAWENTRQKFVEE